MLNSNFLIYHRKSITSHTVLIVFSMIIFLPILWLLRVALTDKVTAYKIPPEWVDLNFYNFVDIFVNYPFVTYFTNSIIVAISSTLISLPLAAFMAYAFSRYNTGGTILRLLVFSTQLLPPIIIVLPLFSLYLKLSLLNSLTGLIISHIAISLPFLAWILVTFFEGNLTYLEQAARVDGASRLQAFFYITIPVSAPGLIAAGVLAFILSWNEFILALILSGPQTNTVPVGLSSFQTHRGVDIAPLAAATICTIAPVFIMLPFMKKYLISGLSLGSIK